MELKSLIKVISRVDAGEALKAFFKEDFGEKDVELIVNGLAKRLTPKLQSTLILTLIKYRNREIKETREHLNNLIEDRDELISTIVESTKT